ncbi:AT hook motif protein [Gregarina niphandrodes]|uniref:AT hook motif protein n=1 Tax=Gregarina niphandrodes TaxID=110365 RepID=A0A023AZH6_GRENI|nr:AT hook motif protein [Gregarina niphandrodes]EZG44113.1 AT hook motif protein [Gregarina niphandrodes]|eukprot:XP_011132797.1 AT hook motif protein [Gregarina niphandrodes]
MSEVVVKRGRGRPRKHPPDVTVVKRPRGRPRKYPIDVPVIKRGRGRPRIRPLPDPNAIKRGPGRPRKTPALLMADVDNIILAPPTEDLVPDQRPFDRRFEDADAGQYFQDDATEEDPYDDGGDTYQRHQLKIAEDIVRRKLDEQRGPFRLDTPTLLTRNVAATAADDVGPPPFQPVLTERASALMKEEPEATSGSGPEDLAPPQPSASGVKQEAALQHRHFLFGEEAMKNMNPIVLSALTAFEDEMVKTMAPI